MPEHLAQADTCDGRKLSADSSSEEPALPLISRPERVMVTYIETQAMKKAVDLNAAHHKPKKRQTTQNDCGRSPMRKMAQVFRTN